jgi:antitoxin ParD1/3/4
MTTLNLNLSEELQQFVNGQAEAGKFDGAAAYVEALIERAKNGKEKLEALLIEGLDSGEPIPLVADEWTRIRRDVEQRLANG